MVIELLKVFWFPLVIGGFIAALAIAGRVMGLKPEARPVGRKRDGDHDD